MYIFTMVGVLFPRKAIVKLMEHLRNGTVLESSYCRSELIAVRGQSGLLRVITQKVTEPAWQPLRALGTL